MEFKRYKLDDLSIGGGFYGIGASAVEYNEELYTYLRITDINNDGTLNYKNLMSVDAPKANQYILKKNDICFARTGNSTGKSYFYDGSIEKLVYAGFLIKFSIDENKVNPKYIKYYTMTNEYKNWVKEIQTGSTRGNINAKMYGNLEILLPERAYQDKLVAILDKITEKIEYNTQTNDNLHDYCKLLFAKVFNKECPKEKLQDVCLEITRGYTKNYVKKSNIINLNQKVNKGEKLEKQYFKYLDQNQIIPENRFARKNDVLLNSLGQGTLGRVHFYRENSNNVVIDQHITIIRTDDKVINSYYLYYLLITKEFQNELEGLVTGTTGMQMLNISSVRELKIPIPNKENVEYFENKVRCIQEKININNLQNQTLEQLRDTLLPKLMNGEINLDKIEI